MRHGFSIVILQHPVKANRYINLIVVQTIYWTVFNLDFINDFQIYKMADNYSVVQSVKFNEFW